MKQSLLLEDIIFSFLETNYLARHPICLSSDYCDGDIIIKKELSQKKKKKIWNLTICSEHDVFLVRSQISFSFLGAF